MSITDELRAWVRDGKGSLLAIADRIDAEYQKAIRELNNLADASVLLPVDADGEYIHVGDVMEERSGHTFEVASLMAFGGSDNWLVLSDPRNFSSFREPNDIRHHHAPTVEDVLFEFAQFWSDEELTDIEHLQPDAAQTIAEYAARLRLAGDGA